MKIELGSKASFTKTISETDIYLFAGITGDFNKIHVNEIEARKTIFGSRIAHGMLGGSLISTVFGTKYPGEGTIYLEQLLRFIKPVYINDTVTATVIATDIINKEKGIYKFETVITNNNGDIVTEGYAIIKYTDNEKSDVSSESE